MCNICLHFVVFEIILFYSTQSDEMWSWIFDWPPKEWMNWIDFYSPSTLQHKIITFIFIVDMYKGYFLLTFLFVVVGIRYSVLPNSFEWDIFFNSVYWFLERAQKDCCSWNLLLAFLTNCSKEKLLLDYR